MNVTMKPIGTMKSLFHFKNGTPRQASVVHNAPGILTIEKSVFNNPEHSLEGLEEYSHAWIIFIFHKNNNAHTKAKVKPPRLDGKRTGVFSSRSPYRPNNIGLSLVKIDKIEGPTIHFSGIDMIDGTPVLDIKPYIPQYDCPTTNLYRYTDPAQQKLCEEETDVSLQNNTSLFTDMLDNKERCGQNNSVTSTNGIDELEKGFYAMSAALNKAGEKLASETSLPQGKDNGEHNLSCVTEGINHSSISDSVLPDPVDDTEDDLDVFLGGIISQAVQSLSPEPALHQDIHSKSKNCKDTSNTDKRTGHASRVSSDKESESSLPADRTCETNTQPHDLEAIKGTAMSRETNCETVTETVVPREPTHSENASPSISPVVAPWLLNPPVQKLNVTFTTEAMQQLQQFSKSSSDPDYRLQLLSGPEDTKSAISDVLREEPRSVYRRQHCQDSLYFFTVDVVHVTCWFDEGTAQVVRLKPVATVAHLQGKMEEDSQS